ncbi:hypothetical protein BDP81DRAFT_38122 [Colletotrichum phormii]|uniref:Uncharacterized protein n=1 Tax=Colletotrichum phormii TaxID=359342 RepID=A0AAI9ZNU5_9PEZI|nr:uncharacterized protein BDP81DRAFT_38122 [Colletotrichum phormii]KAK1635431.1 hypothetical protein BDP81DRAFT_38122 [Colletotrichum phormii]
MQLCPPVPYRTSDSKFRPFPPVLRPACPGLACPHQLPSNETRLLQRTNKPRRLFLFSPDLALSYSYSLLLLLTLTPSVSALSSSNFSILRSSYFFPPTVHSESAYYSILLSFLYSIPDPEPSTKQLSPVYTLIHIHTSLTPYSPSLPLSLSLSLSLSHCSHAHSCVVCFRPYLSQLGSRRPLHRPTFFLVLPTSSSTTTTPPQPTPPQPYLFLPANCRITPADLM